jgi:ribonuclease-3
MSAEAGTLEAGIGYTFRDQGLLRRALTHTSHAHEKPASAQPELGDNERLEFLGDSILGFLVSELLLERFPGLDEGRLSKLKARLVSAAHLHRVASSLGIGGHLLLGHGEELSGGRAKKTLLADALEALIAAIYLDGGLPSVSDFVRRHVVGSPEAGAEDAGLAQPDYKGALQEAAQARGLPVPRYSVVREQGPEHAKTFVVEARIGAEWAERGEGLSKKSAGQRAAQLLLEKLTGTGL